MESAASGPLAGVRVIDMTSVLMGPYATQILGDYGADVVKVEPPAGDGTRLVGPMRSEAMGHIFLHVNRNKRSVVLDLKQADGREALLRLIDGADVFISNMRPAALERLGIRYEQLCERNPRLIAVGLVGYGQKGAYAAKPAYDDLVQGATGIPALVKAAGGTEPRYAPVTLSDRAVALGAVNAILAALYSRDRIGGGQYIEVPMFEFMVQFVWGDHLGGETFLPAKGPPGYPRLLAHDRRPYATKDGYVCVLVYTDRNWRAFLAEIGKPDLFETDARFATLGKRTENIGALYAMVAEAIRTRTTADWLETLERLDIPAMPMHDAASLLEDPHLASVGFFRREEHPSEGSIRVMDIPGAWSKTPPSIRRHAPKLGEQSREVLREAGFSDAEIDDLLARKVSREAGAGPKQGS